MIVGLGRAGRDERGVVGVGLEMPGDGDAADPTGVGELGDPVGSIAGSTDRSRFMPPQLDIVGRSKTSSFLTSQPPTTTTGMIAAIASRRRSTRPRHAQISRPQITTNQIGWYRARVMTSAVATPIAANNDPVAPSASDETAHTSTASIVVTARS